MQVRQRLSGWRDPLPAPFNRADLSVGNNFIPLQDGDEAYPAMLAAIASARRFIHLETYILDPDNVGGRFVRALAERARAGVRVRVVVDAVGCYRLPREWIHYLEAAGAFVHVFNPIRFAPLEMLTKRNHRKLLVVDGALAFAGGMNISSDHVCAPLGKAWRDCMFSIGGPGVRDLDQAFVRTYRLLLRPGEPDGRDLAKVPTGTRAYAGEGRMQVQANTWYTRRYDIRDAYIAAIKNAQSEIFLAQSYFVPDLKLRRALARARKKGVRVRLLLPGVSDVPIVKRAMEALYGRWLSHRMEVREWPFAMMHLKLGVFDGKMIACGSYNLDDRSLRKNLELALWISDSPVVAQIHARLEEDWAKSEAVTSAVWEQRPWLHRLREWIAFRLRKRM